MAPLSSAGVDVAGAACTGTGTGVGACVVCSWVEGDTIGGVAFLGKMVYKIPPIIAIAMSAVPTSDPPPESAICS